MTAKSDIEYEVKFYPVNKDQIRAKLTQVGATLVTPERKMRRIIADQRNNTNINCDYIRIRDEGGKIRLSAKTHAKDGEISDQKELDVEITDFDRAKQLLELSGLKFNRYQETLRETWNYKNAEIVIDTWPGVEPLIEIESDSEDNIRLISQELGFDWQKRMVVSTPEIHMKVYGLTDIEVLDKMSNLTFENNSFNGLPIKWTGIDK